MKLSPKAAEVADHILEAFRSGAVPQALANLYIRRHVDSPCRAWSLTNRLAIALAGHYDARGFRQWADVGRNVKKGSRATYILAPMKVKAREDDPDRGIEAGDTIVIGFRAVPVFGYLQTEGDPRPGMEDTAQFIDALPLVEVAREWGLSVEVYHGDRSDFLGIYQHGTGIALSVANLSTWAHELIHAADDRLGNLTPQGRTAKLDAEVVAEFGGAILLECLGNTVESDRGGAFAYIDHYAREHEVSVITVCTDLLARTCAAVDHVLAVADELATAASPQAPVPSPDAASSQSLSAAN